MKTTLHVCLFSYLLLQAAILPMKSVASDPDLYWSERYAKSRMKGGGSVIYYVAATEMKGFRVLWEATGDSAYYYFIKEAVDMDLDAFESLPGNDYVSHDIDYINGASLVLSMYAQTGELKYQSAADSALKHLNDFPRTLDSGFYHKDWPRMQVDDLYMGSPFLAEYGQLFDKQQQYRDAVIQATTMEKHTRDSATGLYYHAWYETDYFDIDSGCTPYFWGRGVGWVAMALVDILDFLSMGYAGRDSVIGVFQRLAEAISEVQDDSTGVWWQVLDKGDTTGNFLESSASCMFVYALAKGIRKGYINESYWSVAYKGYQGILDNFIIENEDSSITITNVCPGQSPGYTYDNYVRTPYENGHAVGPFLMASVEVERNGLSPSDLTAKTISHKQINLTWKDNTDDENGFRIVRSSGASFTEIAFVGPDTKSYADTTLMPLTTYTYRVQMYKGDLYSVYSNSATATTLAENGAPAYASQPLPDDGESSVYILPELRWTPGAETTSHDVYFGTTNPPPFVGNKEDSIYLPGILEYNTTYYWQVNEVNDSGTTVGDIWYFTTVEAMVLAAHWKLDENAGDDIYDYSGNHLNGHCNNMDGTGWIPGILGHALQFDGTDDFILVYPYPFIDFANQDFSISFWLKQSVTDRSMTYIIKESPIILGSMKRYGVYYDHLDHQVVFEISNDETASMAMAPDTNFITGEWVHVVAVRNTITDSLLLYADTKLLGAAYENTDDIPHVDQIIIGASHYSWENTYFEGALDDIRIYKYAMNDEDIKSIYNEVITGIKDLRGPVTCDTELNIYPNPVTAEATITYAMTRKEKVRLSVYSLTGREIEVLADQIKPAGKHTCKFDVSKLNRGVYILKLQTDSGIKTNKILNLK